MARQDSSQVDFWETRYRDGVTPWEAGQVPPAFAAFVASHAPARILVPGCGSAYEARLLADAGWDVLAIDYSPAAVEAARGVMGPHAQRVQLADFFDFAAATPPYAVVYERALLCALPREMNQRWAARMAQLVAPQGLLAGYYFFDDNTRGPPFGIARAQLEALLGADFEQLEDAPVPAAQSLPVFAGKERWQVWRRRAA